MAENPEKHQPKIDNSKMVKKIEKNGGPAFIIREHLMMTKSLSVDYVTGAAAT